MTDDRVRSAVDLGGGAAVRARPRELAAESSVGPAPIAGAIRRAWAKRALDVGFALAALIFLLPILLATALAVRLESRGPILFRQRRYGAGGKTFNILKFRSMRVAETGVEFTQARRHDPRLTRIGLFLRRTSIDELPQLLNVLAGDMSLVGPRPHAVPHDDELALQVPGLMHRYAVRPGMTGWAQVNGHRGGAATSSAMTTRLEHDLWYIQNWSLRLDLKIIVRTLTDPVCRENAY